jgi:hypothetical protein
MKKRVLGLIVFLGMASGLYAAGIRSEVVVLSSGPLAYSANLDLNLDNNWADSASVQILYSTATFTAISVDASSFDVTTGIIVQPNGFSLALPVLLGKTAGTTLPTGLVDKTTYYITGMTSTQFILATTSTGAIASAGITSYVSSGNATMSLTPIATLGTYSFKLQGSNDGYTFSDIYISSTSSKVSFNSANGFPCSQSVATPWTGGSVFWDLGQVYFSYLRIAYTNGTWGALRLIPYINVQSEK